jgi:2,4-dienoyl-CoA reductase (NADPH2)
VRAGRPERVRPCTLANQHRARDPRNPLVSDEAEPRSGHETLDPPLPVDPRLRSGPPLLVVGGGPAGMEAARTAALLGRPVRLVERSAHLGGALRLAAALPGRARFGLLVDWWEGELARLGVEVCLRTTARPGDLVGEVVLATGSVPSPPTFAVAADARVLPAAEFLQGHLPAGADVVVHDPVGDWTGVGIAELVAAAGLPSSPPTPSPGPSSRAPATSPTPTPASNGRASSGSSSPGSGRSVADRRRSLTCTMAQRASFPPRS